MKKLTLNFVKEKFAEEGYTVLSDKYVGANIKLKCKCSKGHIFYISWNKFTKGQRCKYCNNKATYFTDIISSIEKDNYKILNDIKIDYKNTRSKLYLECPKGHKFYTTFSHWQQGTRCKRCYFNSISITKNTIVESISKEGYHVVSYLNKYVGSKTNFEIMCKDNHRYTTNWNIWQRGSRCKICSNNKRFDKLRLSYEEVKDNIEKCNYKLLSKKYINAFTKLEVKCPKLHRYFVKWNDWKSGYRCPYCANVRHAIRFSGKGHPNWKGGISCEPYCQDWTKEFKDFIKERDGNKCLNPDCWKNDKVLTVHHIDYNKKNCSPENLITVCRSCNIRANKDRKWHKAWYQAIMYRRYKYIY